MWPLLGMLRWAFQLDLLKERPLLILIIYSINHASRSPTRAILNVQVTAHALADVLRADALLNALLPFKDLRCTIEIRTWCFSVFSRLLENSCRGSGLMFSNPVPRGSTGLSPSVYFSFLVKFWWLFLSLSIAEWISELILVTELVWTFYFGGARRRYRGSWRVIETLSSFI